MNYFKNPEIKIELLIHLVIATLCTLGMFLLCGLQGALGTVLICTLYLFMDIVANCIRYHHTEKMSSQIDQILHGEDVSLIQDCKEGDIAILATQINKMVRRLKEQSDQLISDKIFMADYMADISHQIKTPLTSIRLILSFLQEENLTMERRLTLTQELSQLVKRIEWLVYALLQMSKLDAGTIKLKRDKINVATLWKHAYETLAIPLELRGIDFQCCIKESVSMIGDVSWMSEAMGNILKNCMEHTPEGGKITVTAEENMLYTLIRIEDTGTGIAEEDLPHIFERFYRGKNSDSQSVGIGLALSHRIISEHNGTIQAGNRKKGTGAFFEIRFYKTVV